MRATVAALILVLVLAALVISNRQAPLMVAAHNSGRWTKADYPECTTIKPPPLIVRRGIPIEGSDKTSEVV